jgi:hypothetical protein
MPFSRHWLNSLTMSQVRTPPPVASPVATGGGGVFFEQHVGAAFLSLLLVRGIPPCLPGCQLVEVHFQTRHAGWRTDDLLLIGEKAGYQQSRLAAQVKRKLIVSRHDRDFQETIANAWGDFCAKKPFNSATDAFAIITLRGSESLLNHFAALLDCARFCRDSADFSQRLATPGLISKTAKKYYDEICAVIEQAMGCAQAQGEMFAFLKHLFLLSFDLNSPTAQTEAWVKTLLAHTASGGDRVGASNTTWNELLALVGAGEPQAAKFAHADLPESTRRRHGAVPDQDFQALATLQQHSWPIQRGTTAKIAGTFHLERATLLFQILNALDSNRIVLVTGAAGSGKSALAAEVFEKMKLEMPAFAFRAEEFSRSHLDETLHAAQVQLTAQQLSALLALQPRKLFWIESLERLLERTERAALADLLQMVRDDQSCGLLLTCRDYSVDLIRSSFLEQAGLAHEVIIVPSLSDGELEQVLEQFPQLKPLSVNPGVRQLLLNPYIIDKAARMDWKAGAPLPENERSFRAKVWRESIREDHRPSESMPHRRGRTFIEVALLRARSLSPYADCSKLDRQALDRLHESGLIEYSEASRDLVAPAHDILEDWALLEWMDEEFAKKKSDPEIFLLEVGTHPALRRSYRKWLEEILEYAPQDGDRLVVAILANENLPQQSRDDTLVAVLLSKNAEGFLERNEAQMLAGQCSVLRRVIHLIRVGCKSSVGNVATEDAAPWVQYLPKYPAWAAVLRIVRKNLTSLAPRNGELILGLLEDWAQGVNWLLPYPKGAKDAAEIAFSLLPESEDWRRWEREATKRLLKVIVKIPRRATEQIKNIAERAKGGRDDHVADEFAELVLEHLDGIPMCRDCPQEVIQMAEAKWGISSTKEKSQDWSEFRDHFNVEVAFGLPMTLSFDYYPASAYHGPFRALLGQHPKQAVDFIIRFSNYCADSYADPKIFHRFVELPTKTSLVSPDETTKEQWCSWRLWALYRGAHVGPHVLESALMALEHWLLQLRQSQPDQVEAWLMQLLTQSNNVGITAVVASVAIAHPGLAGAAGPILLTSSELIEMDRARMVHDYHPIGRFFDGMPANSAEHAVFNQERKESDSLAHRRHDLEYLAIQLQTGPQRNRVREILDNYDRRLPPAEQQTEADKLWRLALLRMDLRKYEVKSQMEDGRQLIGPKQPDPEVQAVIDAHSPKQQAFDERMRLVGWGVGVFRRENKPHADPSKWREWLLEAQKIYDQLGRDTDPEDEIGARMAAAGPAYVAAILVRDHWDDLNEQERQWVVSVIIRSVAKDADSNDDLFIAAKNAMDASRPAALILPALFHRGLRPEVEGQLLGVLGLALTHASEEVTDYAVEGVGAFLWASDRNLALTCIAAFVAAAALEQAAVSQQRSQNLSWKTAVDSILGQAKQTIRKAVLDRVTLDEGQFSQLDFDDWPGHKALHYILPIFAHAPDEAHSRIFFVNLSVALTGWWRADLDRDRRRAGQRHYQLEHMCADKIARFVLRLPAEEAVKTCMPLIDAAIDCPKEAGQFLEQLIIAEDSVGSSAPFWTLWQAFADRALKAPWAASLNDRYKTGVPLINALFLDVSWNEGVRAWQRLTGNESRLDRFFEALPPNAPTLVAYSRYLSKVGENSLPDALVFVSVKLRQAGGQDLLLTSEAQFYLESILRRWVLSQPGKLKEKSVLRDAVLHILDELVEAGSSVAYRLRDDFVTPAAITSGPKVISETLAPSANL